MHNTNQAERNLTWEAGKVFGHHTLVTQNLHNTRFTYRYVIRGQNGQPFDGANSCIVRQHVSHGIWHDDEIAPRRGWNPFNYLAHRTAVALVRDVTREIPHRAGLNVGAGEVDLRQWLLHFGNEVPFVWQRVDLERLERLRQDFNGLRIHVARPSAAPIVGRTASPLPH